MDILVLLKKYKYISVPAISILASSLFFYLMIITSGYTSESQLVLLLPPLIVFVVMHYLDLYPTKRRLLVGVVVLLVLAPIACIAYSDVIYDNVGPASATLSGGFNVTSSVTPFTGSADSYNFSLLVSTNTSNVESFGLQVRSIYSNNFVYNLSYNLSAHSGSPDLHHADVGTDLLLYFPNATLSPDAYNYTFYINHLDNSLPNLGAVGTSSALYSAVISQFVLSYMVLFNLIFVAGVFVARSISHSKKYSANVKRKQEEQ